LLAQVNAIIDEANLSMEAEIDRAIVREQLHEVRRRPSDAGDVSDLARQCPPR
jgi:hypothetical protein